jgi:anti-anti-sigma regulatory factor
VDVHDAFEILRSNAGDRLRGLTATADELVAGTISIDAPDATRVAPVACGFTVAAAFNGQRRLVCPMGELDLATRIACFNACVTGDGNTVEVDISAVTFLDCSGYGALVAARLVLEERGGTLAVRNPTGQPRDFLGLLDRLAPSP